ncbi:tetraacyldisaccharide 4'-kinase [Pedobacter frigiditerrae]|uniref:Tetraacyldisaccharide 4'-kinase n=1 Tax=Pedobacter frigiditerrae TaxID=2530452 RepID=A0A4R0MN35_9SPHI|nr:tetraacyldisaccharide 4'-kinase [Pedobacter frigiditerrae]TCC88150.1 tetraacyldisaccharide 4'-kinase [Pedobacter frigiditerrae]
MIKYLRLFLLPFSVIYGFIILLRNKLYDWGFLKSTKFDLPVICIGNLVIGGAGKTPTTEYLVRLLADYKIAILSRGYGRETKGFLLADKNATAKTVGDEPMQYFQKFKNVTVAVCEDRVFGINQLKNSHDVILLDDAYQHRAVKAGFNLLLFDYASTKKFQFMLPAGNLREPWRNYDRAQAVLVTKTPLPLNMMDQIEVRRKIDTRIDQRISFSSIKYGNLIHLHTEETEEVKAGNVIFLLTAIANPKPLKSYLEGFSTEIQQFEYPDHHNFSSENINTLINAFYNHPAKQKIIITTEKDSQRLLGDNLKDLLLNLPIYYLPIEIELAPKDKFTFDKNILDYVANHKRIS